MCLVSTQLKLCTCGAKERPKNFWTFYRYDKKKDLMVMGSLIIPVALPGAIELLNQRNLLKRINEADAFDVNLNPAHKDRLELHFSYGQKQGQYVAYGFEFRAGAWQPCPFDCFDWEGTHNAVKHGKIEPALEGE